MENPHLSEEYKARLEEALTPRERLKALLESWKFADLRTAELAMVVCAHAPTLHRKPTIVVRGGVASGKSLFARTRLGLTATTFLRVSGRTSNAARDLSLDVSEGYGVVVLDNMSAATFRRIAPDLHVLNNSHTVTYRPPRGRTFRDFENRTVFVITTSDEYFPEHVANIELLTVEIVGAGEMPGPLPPTEKWNPVPVGALEWHRDIVKPMFGTEVL